MTSIVVHYQEIALKGKNRPWFLGRLVRNLQARAVGPRRHRGARADGAHRDSARSRHKPRGGRRARPRARSASRTFRRARRTTLDLDVIAAVHTSTTCATGRAPAFASAFARADKRFPMTSPQVEREIGGRIKQARGWTVDLDERELTDPCRAADDRGVLLLRQGARRRRPADGHRRTRHVPAVRAASTRRSRRTG